MKRIETKEISNGNKLVVVNINKGTMYAPKYSDIREIKRQLISLYGKEEVKRETNPNYYKHIYRYKVLGQIENDEKKKLIVFGVIDKTTGMRRVTLKDENTGEKYPLSMPNALELMQILGSILSEKEKIVIEDKYNWLIPVINERYAGELIGMILESKDYGITVKEVKERFNFPDMQKARNVLFKFKKTKFLTGQRTVTREMFYTPTIDRIELINFIKILYRVGEKDVLDWR